MSVFTNLRALQADRFFRLTSAASLVMLVAGLAFIWWQLFPEVLQKSFVPLHYNIHFGVDQIGPWWQLFLPPAIAVLLSIGNTLYAAFAWHRERVISYAFVTTTLLVNLFVLLHVIFIVLQNISYA